MKAAAADQYFLENGVSSMTQGSLVGTTNYVKALNLVANETYPDSFTAGHHENRINTIYQEQIDYTIGAD